MWDFTGMKGALFLVKFALPPKHYHEIAKNGAGEAKDHEHKVGNVEEGEQAGQQEEGAQSHPAVLRPSVVVEHWPVKLLVLQPAHQVFKLGGDDEDVAGKEDEAGHKFCCTILPLFEDRLEAVLHTG